jgi:hypothetical protein
MAYTFVFITSFTFIRLSYYCLVLVLLAKPLPSAPYIVYYGRIAGLLCQLTGHGAPLACRTGKDDGFVQGWFGKTKGELKVVRIHGEDLLVENYVNGQVDDGW